MNNQNNLFNQKDADSTNEDGLKAFKLLIIFFLIIGLLFLLSGGSFSENDSGAIWWLLIIAIPVYCASILHAISGLKGSKKGFSIISLLIQGLIFIGFLFLYI